MKNSLTNFVKNTSLTLTKRYLKSSIIFTFLLLTYSWFYRLRYANITYFGTDKTSEIEKVTTDCFGVSTILVVLFFQLAMLMFVRGKCENNIRMYMANELVLCVVVAMLCAILYGIYNMIKYNGYNVNFDGNSLYILDLVFTPAIVWMPYVILPICCLITLIFIYKRGL